MLILLADFTIYRAPSAPGCCSAAIISLLTTAKLNDLEPAAWLKDTLEKLPSWPNSRIDELLPLAQADRVKVVGLDAHDQAA